MTDFAEGELFQVLEDDGTLPEEQVLNMISISVPTTESREELFLRIVKCFLLRKRKVRFRK